MFKHVVEMSFFINENLIQFKMQSVDDTLLWRFTYVLKGFGWLVGYNDNFWFRCLHLHSSIKTITCPALLCLFKKWSWRTQLVYEKCRFTLQVLLWLVIIRTLWWKATLFVRFKFQTLTCNLLLSCWILHFTTRI